MSLPCKCGLWLGLFNFTVIKLKGDVEKQLYRVLVLHVKTNISDFRVGIYRKTIDGVVKSKSYVKNATAKLKNNKKVSKLIL